MYSQESEYHKIVAGVGPALSTFVLSLVASKIAEEANKAIETKNGLHVSLTGKSCTVKTLEWTDIGACTFENVLNLQEMHQPISRYLLMRIAARKDFVGSEKRPVNQVSLTHSDIVIIKTDINV